MKLAVAAKTDSGVLSDHNEDYYVTCPELGLFLVADGVGGHQAGEVASRLGCELVQQYVQHAVESGAEPSTHDEVLAAAIADANRGIYELGQRDPAKRGLGATLTALWFHGDRVLFACVGDSRIYLFRDGVLHQLSADEKAGRYRLAASLGHEETVAPQLGMVYLRPGDRFLLCTDGLYGPVSQDSLVRALTTEISPSHCCAKLIDKANHKGGPDNITALLADVAQPDPRQPWHFARARVDATSLHARMRRFRWWLWVGAAAVVILALLAWAISLRPREGEPGGPQLAGRFAVLVEEANLKADIGDESGALKALRDLVEQAIRDRARLSPDQLGLHDAAAALYPQAAEDVWDRLYAQATHQLARLKGTPAEPYIEAQLAASREELGRIHAAFRQGDYCVVKDTFAKLAAEADRVLQRARQDLEREKGELANAIALLRRRALEFEAANPTRKAVEARVAAAEQALARDGLVQAQDAIRHARAILDGREDPGPQP